MLEAGGSARATAARSCWLRDHEIAAGSRAAVVRRGWSVRETEAPRAAAGRRASRRRAPRAGSPSVADAAAADERSSRGVRGGSA